MASLALPFPPRPRQSPPRRSLIATAVALALAQHGAALAGPAGAQVAAGQVAVTRPTAAQTVVTQSSQAAIVNWRSFSVGSAERVDFRQPGAASVILNRVGGGSPSEIHGQLNANGKVFLVNPSGVLFGRGAQVDVGALVASTLDVADADFMAGRYRFAAVPGTARVANLGRIQAAERGTVALLGASVNNEGLIRARLGTVAMAAGDKITVDFAGDGLTKLRVDAPALGALVANRGMVVADGGQAVMTAHAAQALADTVLDQQGVVRAQSLVERDGRIYLDGGAGGVTLASGTLDVSGAAPGRSGGSVQVLGHHVGLTGNALVDARGDAGGGTILVGGDAHGANPAVRNADATFAGPGTRLLADALGAGHGGKVVLWSDKATRVYGTVSAAGGPAAGDGGFIETSGKFLDVAGAVVGAPARSGTGAQAGRWLLDPFNISIVASGESGGVGSGPDFVSTQPSTQISGATIVNALNTQTDVTVTTGPGVPGADQPGDINVNTSIVKTTGGPATLTLNAARDINIVSSGTAGPGPLPILIASTAPGGPLNLALNANANGNVNADPNADVQVNGRITMTNLTLNTNGGDVRMYGQSSVEQGRATARTGVGVFNDVIGISLVGTTINTNSTTAGVPGGSILMRGRAVGTASDAGVSLVASTLDVGTGSIGIDGVAGAGGTGVSLGNFNLDDPSDAVSVTVSTRSGPVSITGSGDFNGVALNRAAVNANAPLAGQGPGPFGPALAMNGSGGFNGISLANATLTNQAGPINLTGIGAFNAGVTLNESALSAVGNGAIAVRGRGGGAAAGVSSIASSISTSNGTGPISISGETVAPPPFGEDGTPAQPPGISIDAASIIGGAGTSGDITLRALNPQPAVGAGGDMIALAGTVGSTGALALLPGGVSAAGALTEAAAVPIDLFAATTNFSLDQAELTQVIQPGFARVTIGSTTHTGPINVAAGGPFAGRYDLTLQNGGAGSQGIALPNGLSNPGRLTVLSSGVAVTQGGPIVSGSLLLHGTQATSGFVLTNPANAVGAFSTRFDTPPAPGAGAVSVVNTGDLDVRPLSGAGFNAATNAPQPIDAPIAVAGGDLFLQTTRDLILNQNIATLASNITLVAGRVLNNAASATLSPGGGGIWTIFADTWAGEQAGGLAGSGPTPNLYNCAFGAPCAAALPPGNHFVYRQQPRVDLALVEPNPARRYGDGNPPFPFTASGLVKGDALGAAASGAYATPAGPASPVQSYPIAGAFTSPAGYLVVAAPGTLRVDPATLTYVATPASRLQGRPNPPLAGSVTGLVAGDTLAGATTGTPSFTTPADVATPPGRYPVIGGGLSAVNYVFTQAPGNATALAVVPLAPAYRPDPERDVTFASSELYGQNFGLPPTCAGTGPLARTDASADARDPLAVEWSRVRDNPNLSNCIGLVRPYSCDSF